MNENATKEPADKGYSTKVCLNGLSGDACEMQADSDFNRARKFNYDLGPDFAHYRRQGECPCTASWIALYNSGISRV